MSKLTVAIASDHAGYNYKKAIIAHLSDRGFTVKDYGTHSPESCDYPDFIRPVAESVAAGEFDRGIVLGGSGNGEAITANRIPGARCGVCWNEQLAIWNRSHNDGNVLALGERTVTEQDALDIVDTWLATEFEGGRHIRRIEKIDDKRYP